MINSAEEFVVLRTSENREDYTRAMNEPASVEVWLEIIEKYPEMRIWVARNKTVPNTVLELLAKDDNPSIRSAVADRRKLDVRLLELLSNDSNDGVRLRVAYNTKTPISLLRKLLNDKWDRVVEVAENRLRKASENTIV